MFAIAILAVSMFIMGLPWTALAQAQTGLTATVGGSRDCALDRNEVFVTGQFTGGFDPTGQYQITLTSPQVFSGSGEVDAEFLTNAQGQFTASLEDAVMFPLPPGAVEIDWAITGLAAAAGESTNGSFDLAACSAGSYAPLQPTRICDTRPEGPAVGPNQCNDGGAEAGTLGPAGVLVVTVAGAGGVPVDATAVVANVTVTDASASSFLTVWPDGTTKPNASNLNWTPGATVPNLIEVPLGAGKIDLFNDLGTADVIIDVEGYVDPSATGQYNAIVPSRICDTRAVATGIVANQCNQNGVGAGTLGAGDSIAVTVGGQGGVPATGVIAVVANVTVTGTSAGSYLTVWPDGAARPNASNLNWSPGTTVPNRVIVPVGADGKIDLYNNLGSTDVIVDISGYFTTSGVGYLPLPPTRICDTRATAPGIADNQCNDNGSGVGTLGAGASLAITIAGQGGAPVSGVAAVVINVTVTDTKAASYLTVWPDAVTRPTASDLNWSPATTTANLVVVAVGADGKIDLFNDLGSVNVIVDIEGYYAAVPT